MTSRNIRSRVGWLEKSRKPNDEILVVWRLPGADVSEAVADVDHVAGDRVICITGHCRLARLMSAPGVDASAVVRTAAPVRRGVYPQTEHLRLFFRVCAAPTCGQASTGIRSQPLCNPQHGTNVRTRTLADE